MSNQLQQIRATLALAEARDDGFVILSEAEVVQLHARLSCLEADITDIRAREARRSMRGAA